MELRLTEMGKLKEERRFFLVGVGVEIRSLDFYIIVLRYLLAIQEMRLLQAARSIYHLTYLSIHPFTYQLSLTLSISTYVYISRLPSMEIWHIIGIC